LILINTGKYITSGKTCQFTGWMFRCRYAPSAAFGVNRKIWHDSFSD
jgi:hypothetical protein